MAIDASEPVTHPPLNQLIFSAKIDFLRLATPGKLALPSLSGKPLWARKEACRWLTVHDPSPEDVKALVRLYPSLWVQSMEVAVDVFPKPSVSLAHWNAYLEAVMLGMFAKGLDPRYRGGRQHFRGAAWKRGEKARPFNKRLPNPHHQLVYGRRDESWQTKAYFKQADMGAMLPERWRVARVEVALKLDQLDKHGIHEVSDLVGFRFRRELMPYFHHVRAIEPRIRSRRKPLPPLLDALTRKQSELLHDEFTKVGIGCALHGGRYGTVATRVRPDTAVNNRIGQALHRLQSALSD